MLIVPMRGRVWGMVPEVSVTRSFVSVPGGHFLGVLADGARSQNGAFPLHLPWAQLQMPREDSCKAQSARGCQAD